MNAACAADELAAMARARSLRGTSAGSSACIAGCWKARAAPVSTTIAKIPGTAMAPVKLPIASTSVASACSDAEACSVRRRSK